MASVERVCSGINQEMKDADMYQKLSKLSKMWGVDVLSRSVPSSKSQTNALLLNQCLLYGGILKTVPYDVELDTLPVLFVTKKTAKKAEPIVFKVNSVYTFVLNI